MIWKPHATVATLVENAGKFLLVEEFAKHEQHAHRPVINQPAGHVDEDESILQAAVRETLEETGCRVELTDLVGIYTFKADNQKTYYRFCFVAKLLEQVVDAEIDSDIERVLWLSAAELNEAKQRHRSPLVARCMNDYLQGKRYPLELIYEHPID